MTMLCPVFPCTELLQDRLDVARHVTLKHPKAVEKRGLGEILEEAEWLEVLEPEHP